MDAVTDDDLILMYRQGDADAFDALFDRHHAPVYHFARAVLAARRARLIEWIEQRERDYTRQATGSWAARAAGEEFQQGAL